MICHQRFIRIGRPLIISAAFLFVARLIAAILAIALAYGVPNEIDRKNDSRIDAQKAELCAQTPGIADCNSVPTQHHRRD